MPAATSPEIIAEDENSAYEVSLFRLYTLRGTYLLIAAAMGTQIWPLVFSHRHWDDLMHGVAVSMLAAITALCLIGLRYPLKMLPLLFVELAWKTIWVLAMGLPLWRAGQMDANAQDDMTACLMGAIFLIVIPWGYVWRHYVKAPGDRWL
ncbi:MAG TPA: hypothetical protein VMF58_05625 [Rhizomicrobium sp.]|nr:hypothetical protein [Rhizomicrobium sp.]